METSPLNQRFKAFCENLSRRNSNGERDELLAALELYAALSPADMYQNMTEAHSSFFGNSPKGVRYSIDNTMPDLGDLEKAYYLAGAMRDQIQNMAKLPEDTVLNMIYRTTVLFQENTGHVWECLLAAATYYKKEMMPPENDPRNFLREVFMSEVSEEERGLYGDFDPTPVSEPHDSVETAAPRHNPPKFLH